MRRSTLIRPCSSSGRPNRAITGWGFTPAVQTNVRVGIVSPSERRAEVAVTSSTRVEVRISTPRARSSPAANSARSAGTSLITRSRASTSTQRIPWVAQRG